MPQLPSLAPYVRRAPLIVAGILGHPPGTSIHLPSTISALAISVGKPEWASIGDIDVPLRQRPLSHVINESSHADLLVGAPDSRSKALALSSAIRHAGDWLNVVPWAFICRTKNSTCACSTGLASLLPQGAPSVPFARSLPIHLWTTKWGVGVMGTESTDTIQSTMQCIRQPNPLPLRRGRNCRP